MASPKSVVINNWLEIPMRELSFSASRSGGPGGQHVNKTSSKITLRFDVLATSTLSENQKKKILRELKSNATLSGEIVLSVESSRSQFTNKTLALEKFAELLRNALKSRKKRVPTGPSRGAIARRLDDKKLRGTTKKYRKKPDLT